MDKRQEQVKKSDWSWLPQRMPGVTQRIAELRAKYGNDHVALCWQRGVVGKEPGWFYAREGALAVGVPWDGCELELAGFPTASGVWIRPAVGGDHGQD